MSKNNFRQRTEKAWKAFAKGERFLRRLLDSKDRNAVTQELIGKCSEILELAFDGIAFELGFNGEKYELILSPEGNKVRLFELVYFRQHAPASVLKQWNVWVGRQPNINFAIRSGGWDISAEDVQVHLELTDDRHADLAMYCEKLIPLLHEDKNQAWWILSVLVDQVLGEIPAMELIGNMDIVENIGGGSTLLLSGLPSALNDMGIKASLDPQDLLDNSYSGYQIEPDEDPEADLRADVYIGTTRCVPLIVDYLNNENANVERLNGDGAEAGSIYYPLGGFTGNNRGNDILDFREELEETISKLAGDDAVTFIGGATGIYCGYLDFIAWDIEAVLKAAEKALAGSPVEWAAFRSFKRGSDSVRLLDRKN